MEFYIQISKINDFLYSPKSLYLHSVYESFDQSMYNESPQQKGTLNHECIEDGKYSTAKRYIQGKSVYSSEYNIGGKIDIYDTQTKSLIERKTRVKKVYDGYRLQYSVFEIRNSNRALQNILDEIELKYRKWFSSADSIVIFQICEADKKKVRRYGYAENEEKEVVVFS